MGQNGAGKSTLIKVLTGVYPADAGQILLAGERDPAGTPLRGAGAGHQHRLPGGEPLPEPLGGREHLPGPLATTRRRAAHRLARDAPRGATALLARPQRRHRRHARRCPSYSVAVQQMVAIARALSMQARMLILDEPTSSLDEDEVKRSSRSSAGCAAQGMAILFVTHFLDQIYADLRSHHGAAQRRAGRRVPGGRPAAHGPDHRDGRARDRRGRPERRRRDRRRRPVGAATAARRPGPSCGARASAGAGSVQAVDLEVRPGEVLGIGGLLGSGRTETGAAAVRAGPSRAAASIRIDGKRRCGSPTPLDAIRHGIGFCPEDRKTEGIIGELSVRENIILALQAKRGVLRKLCPGRARRRSLDALHRARSASRPTDIGHADRACCRAATSRRRCWRAGWPPTRAC